MSPNKHTARPSTRARAAAWSALARVAALGALARLAAGALLAGGLTTAGCGGGAGAGARDAGADVQEAPAALDAGPAAPRCLPPDGTAAAPRSIAEVVALVNSLPRPVTVACFLESLARPLHLQAATSITSLQPSAGLRSPRMFLFSGPLVMSIVPEGKGARLVEFGQLVEPARSLKGEIGFPVVEAVSPAAPFAAIRDAGGTTCRFCHREERRAADVVQAEAFISGALKPQERNRVSLENVRLERERCGPALAGAVTDDRCAMLRALFDHGEVRQIDFPPEIPTIFD